LEFTGGSEENHERSQVRIGGVMVEIWTEHPLSTNEERYQLANPHSCLCFYIWGSFRIGWHCNYDIFAIHVIISVLKCTVSIDTKFQETGFEVRGTAAV
jgi:hypothetical protein